MLYTPIFQRAFDSVNHELLIYKLQLLGFSPSLLFLIQAYLLTRKQRVLFKSAKSKYIHVYSGVPQGILILFTLFFNGLPASLYHSDVLMLADDVKLFSTIKNSADCLLLKADINSMTSWSDAKLLS